uniref:hypothetical protein n=1 Tax=Paraburkholderia caribensis TaxID=75105 RepID=UPI0035B56D10
MVVAEKVGGTPSLTVARAISTGVFAPRQPARVLSIVRLTRLRGAPARERTRRAAAHRLRTGRMLCRHCDWG